MARILCLLLLAFTFARADDECVCADYTDDERKEIWEFLANYVDTTDDEAVLPGLLSPLVPCGNCIDSVRRKRTILPSASDSAEEPVIRNDSRCPAGYGRIGFRCVEIEPMFE